MFDEKAPSLLKDSAAIPLPPQNDPLSLLKGDSREGWRQRYGVSKAMHHTMRQNGTAPRETVIGNVIRILLKDELEWLERTTAESEKRLAELHAMKRRNGLKAAQHPNHPAYSAPARARRVA